MHFQSFCRVVIVSKYCNHSLLQENKWFALLNEEGDGVGRNHLTSHAFSFYNFNFVECRKAHRGIKQARRDVQLNAGEETTQKRQKRRMETPADAANAAAASTHSSRCRENPPTVPGAINSLEIRIRELINYQMGNLCSPRGPQRPPAARVWGCREKLARRQ